MCVSEGVYGCMFEREREREKMRKRYKDTWLIFNPSDIFSYGNKTVLFKKLICDLGYMCVFSVVINAFIYVSEYSVNVCLHVCVYV